MAEKVLTRFETHAHSEYSNIRLLDCINKPKDIIQTAYNKGLSGIALTDHEFVGNAIQWLNAEKKLKKAEKISKDFKCALGNEIYLVGSRDPEKIRRYFHFILIAKNNQGHEALRKLSSIAWFHSYTSRRLLRVPTLYNELKEVMNEYKNSVMATTACLGGELPHLVFELLELEIKSKTQKGLEEQIQQKKIEISEFIKFCKDVFGEDFYIEIAPSKQNDQVNYNLRVIPIAKALGVKIVFGTDAHYLTKEDRPIHKAYLNSKEGEREVDAFYSSAHLMDYEELRALTPYLSDEQIAEFFNNSLEIMDKVEGYQLDNSPNIPTEQVKYYPKLKYDLEDKYPNIAWYLQSESDQDRYWINTVLNKAEEVGYDTIQGMERIEKEADIQRFISERLGQSMSAYHNTMQHYIDLFWECGSIVGPGRGSACGWLTNMLLGITQVDPLKWGLNEWRYLNKERVEIGDIDIDIAPSKRPLIFKEIRKQKGETGLLQICTFGTEGTRSAILTACRGYRSEEFPDGIDVDIAQYMSGMIPQERGFLWPLSDVLNGNEEKGRSPIRSFIDEVNKYPGLLDIMVKIEGLINKRSQHASGVILYNQEFYKTNALMRSPSGDLTTQFSLHDAEQVGDTKFDFLVTEVSDKIIECVKLLQEDNILESELSLREIYNKYLHPNIIPLDDDRIWKALADGSALDVFQFNSDVGLQAAKAIKPTNPFEMTAANALMRLMAEKGHERPLDRYVRMKFNTSAWYEEMNRWNLSKEQQVMLEKYYKQDYGTPPYQESVMLILMEPAISGFTLTEANDARKIIGKKQMERIPELRKKFFDKTSDKNLAAYVWETAILPQMGYSFSVNHSLPYSFVGIQTLVLAATFPDIYWNCACLIVNSGGIEDVIEEDDIEQDEKITPESLFISGGDSSEDDDEEEYDEEEESIGKKEKKKNRTTNYGKIATAIGFMASAGIIVEPPDINQSKLTFSPVLETNSIRYGLKGINKIGDELVRMIIECRPYQSIDEFLAKVKVNKPQMINLIKSGAFDNFGDGRRPVMEEYIRSISDQKKRITLQNMKMLIDFQLLPESLAFEVKVFNFNKYLKKFKSGNYYVLDDIAFKFYEDNFDIDLIFFLEEEPGQLTRRIEQTKWDKIYNKYMDNVRAYIKPNQEKLLSELNDKLIQELWDKYCLGSISKWEMDSVSFYSHEHELEFIDDERYEFTDFFDLEEDPVVENVVMMKGKKVPLFKLYRIAGTVLDKNKNKNVVTVLTKSGVVNVKVWQSQFSKYDKQISVKLATGKKKIIEKSWFSRGNKIAIVGIRRGDMFVPKIYRSSIWSEPFNLITKINEDGSLVFKSERESGD